MIIAIFDPSTEYEKDDETLIAYDNKVKQLELDWKDLVEMLISPPVVNDKKISVSMISGWEYLPPADAISKKYGFTRKVMCNLIKNHLMIIDFDDSIFMGDFIDKYGSYEFVLYSSFSHDIALGYDKFRVIMPMINPVDVDVWERMGEGLIKIFEGCDNTTFGKNRSFFLPHVKPTEINNYVVYHNHGDHFDASVVPLAEEVVYTPIVRDFDTSKEGTGKIMWNTLDVVGLFKHQGLYDKPDGRNQHLVTCPWDATHTSKSSGTAIWERDATRGPGFNCHHHHCHGKKLYDVTQFIGVDVAASFCERKVINTDTARILAQELIRKMKEKS